MLISMVQSLKHQSKQHTIDYTGYVGNSALTIILIQILFLNLICTI